MRVTAGELTERVELQSLTQTADGGGGHTESWATYATVWAKVRPLRGRERENAQQLEASADYRVIIRYRSDVEEAHRILWRSNYLNVRFVADEGPRAMYLHLDAEMMERDN